MNLICSYKNSPKRGRVTEELILILDFLVILILPIIGGVIAIKKIIRKEFVRFNVFYIIGLIIGAMLTGSAGAILLTSGWKGAYVLMPILPLIFFGRYRAKLMGALLILTFIIFIILDYQTGTLSIPTFIVCQLPILVYGLYYSIYADRFTVS